MKSSSLIWIDRLCGGWSSTFRVGTEFEGFSLFSIQIDLNPQFLGGLMFGVSREEFFLFQAWFKLIPSG
ncbi:hypothetical protein K0M31_020027 [Melipona bicolor]|uniref:Uncharacterized protein n=1 Tax=Melipona bicolor TaxID=60889 RepID=A0AA40G0N8_9HYME|nr:hypothetical protein K0M31_020027 [Melipona bicolor]